MKSLGHWARFVFIFLCAGPLVGVAAPIEKQLSLAVGRDIELRAAETELKKAEEAYAFRWRAFLPSLVLSTSEGKTKALAATGSEETVGVDRSTLSAALNVFAGGLSLSAYKQDALSLARQQQVFESKRRAVLLKVADDLFSYIFLRKRRDHLQRQMKNRDQQEDIANKKFKSGVLSQQEWQQTAIARDFQRADLLTIEIELDSVSNRLALVGLTDLGSPDWPLTEKSALLGVRFPPTESSPEVKALAAEVDLLAWRRHSYRAEYLPSVDLFVEGVTDRTATRPSSRETVQGVRLTWAFGDAGHAYVEARKANLDLEFAKQALVRANERVLKTNSELAKKVDGLRALLATLRDSATKSQDVISSLRRAFQVGRLSVTDLLLQENTHLQYLTGYEELNKQVHLARLQICLAAEISLKECF